MAPRNVLSQRTPLMRECVAEEGRAIYKNGLNLQDSSDDTQCLPVSNFSGDGDRGQLGRVQCQRAASWRLGSTGEHLRALPQKPGQGDGQHGTAVRGMGVRERTQDSGATSTRSQGRREVFPHQHRGSVSL